MFLLIELTSWRFDSRTVGQWYSTWAKSPPPRGRFCDLPDLGVDLRFQWAISAC